jgi:hypothetical protein
MSAEDFFFGFCAGALVVLLALDVWAYRETRRQEKRRDVGAFANALHQKAQAEANAKAMHEARRPMEAQAGHATIDPNDQPRP